MEEQEGLGEANLDQPDWMQFYAILLEYNDVKIPDNLAPTMCECIDNVSKKKYECTIFSVLITL